MLLQGLQALALQLTSHGMYLQQILPLLLQADIVDSPNALAHITVLLYHEEAPMRQAAATCLGNLTEHQTRLGATQVGVAVVHACRSILTTWMLLGNFAVGNSATYESASVPFQGYCVQYRQFMAFSMFQHQTT
jgi:hypothetical protein